MIQPAFRKKRWDLAERYLREMGNINASFVERKGDSLSPDQLR